MFFGAKPGGGLLAPVTTSERSEATSRERSEATTREILEAFPPGAAPNPYEVVSAPYVAEAAQLNGAGRLAEARSTAVGAGAVVAGPIHLTDRVDFSAPRGTSIDSGGRALLVRVGPSVTGVGIVVVPTGVVRATDRIGSLGTVPGVIVAQFDEILSTDRVLPLPERDLASSATLSPVTRGATGRVVWIPSGALLPSLQHQVIVDIGERDGVHAGDQLSIRDRPGQGGVTVAVARVLRVGPRSATALIVRESLPQVRVGMEAVLTGKLP